MLNTNSRNFKEAEIIVARSVGPVADDLRLLDLRHILDASEERRGGLGHLEALVNSSIEIFFKPSTLLFAGSVDIDVGWVRRPVVKLGMEFHHLGVHVYFRLVLHGHCAGIEASYLAFDEAVDNGEPPLGRLHHALVSARRSGVHTASMPSRRMIGSQPRHR